MIRTFYDGEPRSHAQGSETQHLDRLSSIVDLDMSKWWQPTARSYLAHVSKDQIAAVVTQAVSAEQAQPLLAMKKAQAAATAEGLLAVKGWVPEMMRTQLSQSPMAVEHPMGEIEAYEPCPPGRILGRTVGVALRLLLRRVSLRDTITNDHRIPPQGA